MAIDRLIARREVGLREKTLYRMLYETAAPARARSSAPVMCIRTPGWDLHELRHSVLTHLGEAGASLLLLMAKSRHQQPENLRRYFKPSDQALAEVTSLLAPADSRR